MTEHHTGKNEKLTLRERLKKFRRNAAERAVDDGVDIAVGTEPVVVETADMMLPNGSLYKTEITTCYRRATVDVEDLIPQNPHDIVILSRPHPEDPRLTSHEVATCVPVEDSHHGLVEFYSVNQDASNPVVPYALSSQGSLLERAAAIRSDRPSFKVRPGSVLRVMSHVTDLGISEGRTRVAGPDVDHVSAIIDTVRKSQT